MIFNLFRKKRTKRAFAEDADRASRMSRTYYAKLHEGTSYQTNNWLLPEIDRALACNPKSVLEIGFGNARFLRAVAERVERVIGVDWVASSMAADLPSNIEIVVADVVHQDLPNVDLACSADVLEHFRPTDLDQVIGRLHIAGRFNFHVIACYDDGHSHLSIFPPEQWLQRFRKFSPEYSLVDVRNRNGDSRKQICLIANF